MSFPPNPLAPIEGTDGLHDLGLNGSYLVVRELKQDVASFWTSLGREAESLNTRAGPSQPPVSADWLAERVVGRTGTAICSGRRRPWPALAGDLPDNTPLYFKTDRRGFGCPMGSHVRRANPRDGLAGDPSACADLLDAANAHRILRRGRKFGPDATVVDGKVVPDAEDRGLLFMCLNTDIVRQFEFVQQNWLLNPNFATLLKEVDPLVGPAGKMTLPPPAASAHGRCRHLCHLDRWRLFLPPELAGAQLFQDADGRRWSSCVTGIGPASAR